MHKFTKFLNAQIHQVTYSIMIRLTNYSNACNVLDSFRCMRYQITSRYLRCNKNIVRKISHLSYILDINIRHHQSYMHEHMTRLNAYVHTNNSPYHHQSFSIYAFTNNSPSLDIYAFTNNIHNSINIYVFTNNISIN